MYRITDEHIEYILRDLALRGVTIPDLRDNLLDHICILAERDLREGDDFEAYYGSILPSFYRDELAEIEAETKFLLRRRRPLVLLSRGRFLFWLFVLLVGPFVGFDLLWLVRVGPSQGYRIPLDVWGGTLVFAQFPLLIWLVLALTPERFDPLLPKGSKVLLGWQPLISIL